MKKLILLLMILALALCGCDLFVDNSVVCTQHVDVDDNGYCDECTESVIVIIDLYAINDLHGKVTASNTQYGIAGLTTYLKKVSDENTILLSSGDMWQGSSESNLTHGALITDWMNSLGFVSMTLGNHEYDWGESYIFSNLEQATFPILGINVYDSETGKRSEYAKSSIVVERGGVQIGIIGAIGNCYSSISGEVSDGFTFKVGDELTALVKEEAKRLRDAGVDFIVYSLHDGYGSGSSGDKYVTESQLSSYYDSSLSDGYVDIVFEGHTHQSYVLYEYNSVGDRVYHLQGGGENKGLSHAEVSINTANRNTKVTEAEIISSSLWQNQKADPIVDTLLEKYADEIDGVNDVIGTNDRYRDDSELEQIIADLYYEYGIEKWGDEYDIALGGGFIRTRNPYNLKAGDVSYADIYSLFPFDNHIVLCSVSGKDLYEKFLTTTNSDYYISGDNLAGLKSNIEYNKTYYIITDTYTSSYRYNNLTEVARYASDVFARDLFAEYVKENWSNSITNRPGQDNVTDNTCTHTNTNVKDDRDPTCSTEGYTGDVVCLDCGKKISTGTSISTINHTYEEGKCIACGAVDPDYNPNDIHEHTYLAVVTAPTCTEDGYTTYTCTCGDTYTADEVKAKGHIHTAKVTNPTCTEDGYTTYTCACGDTYTADEVKAKGHTHTAKVTDPTCTADGYITYTCACGDVYTVDGVKAMGHSFKEGACSVCGAVDSDYVEPDQECDEHTDTDDDGYCDTCSEYVIVVIDIYAVNDLHGKVVAGTGTQYGLGKLTTYLKSVTDENSVLISSGDMWQGSSESNLTHGAIITDWMNELGFSSMTVGNHEYDWGENYISNNAGLADFPILAINVYDSETGALAEYAMSSVIVERDGVEIGIIGAIGNCYSSISGEVSGGFYFRVGSALTQLVKAESDRLRAAGADFIVYSLHDGYEYSSTSLVNVSSSDLSAYYDVALSNGYVDIVFEAHTHQSYVLCDTYGVYHLQGSGENKGISHAEISINSANGNTGVLTAEVIKSNAWSNMTEDPLIAELLLKYEDEISAAEEVLAYNGKYLDDSELEQLVAQLYYELGCELWGDEYDITLGGGFVRTRAPYNLASGTVTYSDIYSLLPFDNSIVLCSISGKDLKSKFINTNNTDYYVFGSNVSASSIVDSKTYYIVTDTYTSTYSYNNLTEVARYDAAVYARDLVADYIRKNWS